MSIIELILVELNVPICDDVEREEKRNILIYSIDWKEKSELMATTPLTNSRSGKHRSDHEIEKYRLELNWTKILDKLKTAKLSGFHLLNLLFYFQI